MSYNPCLNPNCKSNGIPHPNCRCYNAYADGGEIKGFCSEARMHDPSCEYYAEGGEVDPIHESANQHMIGDHDDEDKWNIGNEDHEESVANALIHSGAHQLLNGTMRGVYSDGGLQGLLDEKIQKKILKYLNDPMRDPVDKFVKKTIGMHTNKLAGPLLRRMLSNGESKGLTNLINYANNIKKGSKSSKDYVSGLFKKGGSLDTSISKEDREKLNNFVSRGTFQDQLNNQDTQAFADGGEVKHKHIFHGTDVMERNLPTHNVMIHSAKARVNNYLNSIRPIKQETTLFDPEYEDMEHKRSYERALDVANKPLNVVGHIKNGSILPEHVNHLKNMYPEVYSQLSNKMREKIIEAKFKKERPDYKVRQGMSLFLGTNLDSTLTPQAIQSAQSTFNVSKQQSPAPQASKNKKSKTSLSKAPEDDLTAMQARERRANKV